MAKLLCRVVVAVLLAAGPAAAQIPPPVPAPPTAPAKRATYSVRYGSAGELAAALSQQYQTVTSFRAVAVASSNSVLLSGPPDVVEEALQTLTQLDRKPRSVTVDVFLADVAAPAAGPPGANAMIDLSGLTGPPDEVAAKLEALKRQGLLTGLRRIRVAATEGLPATVNLGEEVPIVTSANRIPMRARRGGDGEFLGGRGGPPAFTTNVDRRNIGSLVEVRPRVSPDGLVLLELKVNDSRIVQADAVSADGSPPAQAIALDSVKATVSVRPGQAVVASGAGGGAAGRRTAVIVAVALAEAGDASRK